MSRFRRQQAGNSGRRDSGNGQRICDASGSGVESFMRILLLSILVVLLPACESKPTWDSYLEENLSIYEKFYQLLEGVETEADAQDAVGEIEKLTERAKKLKEQTYDLTIPRPEEVVHLTENYNERHRRIVYKLFGPEHYGPDKEKAIRKILEPPLKEFVGTMFKKISEDSSGEELREVPKRRRVLRSRSMDGLLDRG